MIYNLFDNQNYNLHYFKEAYTGYKMKQTEKQVKAMNNLDVNVQNKFLYVILLSSIGAQFACINPSLNCPKFPGLDRNRDIWIKQEDFYSSN